MIILFINPIFRLLTSARTKPIRFIVFFYGISSGGANIPRCLQRGAPAQIWFTTKSCFASDSGQLIPYFYRIWFFNISSPIHSQLWTRVTFNSQLWMPYILSYKNVTSQVLKNYRLMTICEQPVKFQLIKTWAGK